MFEKHLYHLNYFIFIDLRCISCSTVIMMYFVGLVGFIGLLLFVTECFDLYNIILYLSLYLLFIGYFYTFKLFFLTLLKLLSIGFEVVLIILSKFDFLIKIAARLIINFNHFLNHFYLYS